jgi:hypothetical protein
MRLFVVAGIAAFLVAGVPIVALDHAGRRGPVVPARVQVAVQRAADPLYRYLPSYAPPALRFRRLTSAGPTVGVELSGRSGSRLVNFEVGPAAPPCVNSRAARSSMHTFHFGAIAVYWSATFEDQQAWRCVKGADGTTTVILASESVYGAARWHDRVNAQLARIVASAARV